MMYFYYAARVPLSYVLASSSELYSPALSTHVLLLGWKSNVTVKRNNRDSSGANQTSFFNGYRGRGVKRPRHEATTNLHILLTLRIRGAIPPLFTQGQSYCLCAIFGSFMLLKINHFLPISYSSVFKYDNKDSDSSLVNLKIFFTSWVSIQSIRTWTWPQF